MTVVGADIKPFVNNLRQVESVAARSGANVRASLNGLGHGNSGFMRELIVVGREISRGNWSRVPSSLSLLIQQSGLLSKIFKDNASAAVVAATALTKRAEASNLAAIAAKKVVEADLQGIAGLTKVTESELAALAADQKRAAGALLAADADRVKAVAATQAAEAMTAEGVSATFALTPLGWIAVALVAAGTAAYFLTKHFRAVSEEERYMARLMDTTNAKMTDQAEAMKKATAEAEAFDDWLKKLTSSEEGLAEATDETLRSMRERAKFEREAAAGHGASKSELEAMDLAAAKKELDVLETAKLQARRKQEQDTDAARAADDEATGFGKANGGQITNLNRKVGDAGAIMDAVQEAMSTTRVMQYQSTTGLDGQIRQIPTGTRAANENDKLTVKVNGQEFTQSLAEATNNFDALSREAEDLVATQKALNDILAQKKELTKRDVEDVKKLSKQASELQGDIALRTQFSSRGGGGGELVHGRTTTLQQNGAYTAPAQIVTAGDRMIDQQLKIIAKLLENHKPPQKTIKPLGAAEH
jgi:hypothetical protein